MATHSAAVAAQRLRVALDAVAAALASADANGLLAAEEELASALTGISGMRSVDASEWAAVSDELSRARASLVRCRTLGRSASYATQATLLALGRWSDYARSGAHPAADGTRGTALEARV